MLSLLTSAHTSIGYPKCNQCMHVYSFIQNVLKFLPKSAHAPKNLDNESEIDGKYKICIVYVQTIIIMHMCNVV